MGLASGGERARAMYTPIGTAKLHGIDSEAHLRYVLLCERIRFVINATPSLKKADEKIMRGLL